MINAQVQHARKKGVHSSRLVPYVRKQLGAHLNVVRLDSEANPQCSVPCVLCRKQIITFGLRVRCITKTGEVFCGFLDDDEAPRSKLTSGQRRRIHSTK
mmetsp:Transcript_4045/g.7781  ORF Transcript_4045/g.7781 Transcript_4045/m.7781 type:complete len:99 (+) Transcript_4045:111-407(+)